MGAARACVTNPIAIAAQRQTNSFNLMRTLHLETSCRTLVEKREISLVLLINSAHSMSTCGRNLNIFLRQTRIFLLGSRPSTTRFLLSRRRVLSADVQTKYASVQPMKECAL